MTSPPPSLRRALRAHRPAGGKLYAPEVQAAVVEYAQKRRAESAKWKQVAGGIRGPVSRSRRGTEVASVLDSLLETAKLHGVNPAHYLREAALADARGEVLLPTEASSQASRFIDEGAIA